MPKSRLIEYYQKSTAIFDQFLFGAFGTTAPEALSCGKPVVGYVESKYWQKYHTEPPPVLNASSEDDIYNAMVKLEDEQLRIDLGKRGRKWIMQNCDYTRVSSQQLELYEEVLKQ
jgi:glycosyltransferase involved in cell wall biosynthesis